MDGIKNDYIGKALDELIPTFGIKESIDPQKFVSLISSKKVKEGIKEIALSLGLPIQINISYVPRGYRPDNKDVFQSTQLVKTESGRGSEGITAQVTIPSDLPMYGASRMVNFPINVRLSENCADNPETLISVMAHELSHIVLHSIFHKEKENEFYTDLTAMLLGFADIMKIGRKVIKTSSEYERVVGYESNTATTYTQTTTYGYLSDDNFTYAYYKINSILNSQNSAKNGLLNKLSQFEQRLNKNEKLSLYFIKCLEYLDKNLNKNIPKEDGQKIGAFHQFGYIDNFQSVTRKNKATAESFSKFVKNLKNYTMGSMETIQRYEAQLKLANEELKGQYILLQKDVNILKKYVSFLHRLKIRFVS